MAEARNGGRLPSAIAVAFVHALLLYALARGLGAPAVVGARDPLKLLDLVAPPPPPPPAVPARPPREQARRVRPRAAEGAAAPANRRDTPTEIVAPAPVLPLPTPPPLPAAPIAGLGSAPAAGAAPLPGPGTGAGGAGSGLGSGASGNGSGGGGGGLGTPLRWLSGSIEPGDYPRRARAERAAGTVGLRFVVGTDGRVADCAVTRSSGHAELDAATCRLIRKRFRYRPARDAAGRLVQSTVIGEHVWEIGPEPPEREVEAEPE